MGHNSDGLALISLCQSLQPDRENYDETTRDDKNETFHLLFGSQSFLKSSSLSLSYLTKGDVAHIMPVKILIASFDYNPTRLKKEIQHKACIFVGNALSLPNRIQHISQGGGQSSLYLVERGLIW